MPRVISWYSCGIASAVATHIAQKQYADSHELVIAYCDTGSEHPDNERFLLECETIFKQEITRLKSKRYDDIWDVFERGKYLVGIHGAMCTSELKKRVRKDFEEWDDKQVFGYTIEEMNRVDNFRKNNPEVDLCTPLVDMKMNKHDCFDYFHDVFKNVRRPEMYRLGFNNNNCIGCVKGGMGYWNHIRTNFPEVFERMSKVERKLDVTICKSYADDGERKRVFLDELAPNTGKHKALFEEDLFTTPMNCDFLCSSEDAK